MDAAKARKSWIEQRGTEVERLISLGGTPLLVDTNSDHFRNSSVIHGENIGGTVITTDDSYPGDQQEPVRDRSQGTTSLHARPGASTAPAAAGQSNFGVLEKSTRVKSVYVWDEDSSGRIAGRTTGWRISESHASTLDISPRVADSARGEKVTHEQQVPLLLDVKQVASTATAGIPLLPCFSRVNSQPALGCRRLVGTAPSASNFRGIAIQEGKLRPCPHSGVKTSLSVGDLSTYVALTHDTSVDYAKRAELGGGDMIAATKHMGWPEPHITSQASVFAGRQRAAIVREATPSKAVATTTRDHADALLASHLTPFPTITKNRSLHGVPQPIVPKSAGFADACRAESSHLGTAAWREARTARYNEMVAPAERLSIAQWIEAGLDTLQGSKDSPVP